jgi:hypothetical protein
MMWRLFGSPVGMVYSGGIVLAMGIAKDHPSVNNLAEQNQVGRRVAAVRG